MFKSATRVVFAVLFAASLCLPSGRIDNAAFTKIVSEGTDRSEVMKNFEYMTDEIGPRLTGSNKFKRACDWTASRFKDYGLKNVHLEPFPFGRGWQRGIAYGRMTAPYEMQLDFRALAWTPGTKGRVSGKVVKLQAATVEDLAQYKGKLQGVFILASPPSDNHWEMSQRPLRMSPNGFNEEETSWPSSPGSTAAPSPAELEARRKMMQAFSLRTALIKFAKEEGAAAVLVDSGRADALFEAGSNNNGRKVGEPESVPMETLTHEHYSTLYRLVTRGDDVKIEMDVVNKFEADDNNAFDVVADLPGSEKPDEIVVLGGHLDSWDLGTGATDNGAGAMAVLEAARILSQSGMKPKRTIRFMLFGGEEQGLLGSRAYVAAHKDEMAKVSGVFVVDTGTGWIRGIGTQKNQAVIPIFKEILAPMRSMDVLYINDRIQIGTDHLSFEFAGVPGFAFFQDAIEYKERTHHSQVDTFDKIIPDAMKQVSITMAWMGYSVAQLPEMLPRKPPAGH